MAAGPVPASIVWKRLNSSCAPCSGIIPSLAWVWLETCLVRHFSLVGLFHCSEYRAFEWNLVT